MMTSRDEKIPYGIVDNVALLGAVVRAKRRSLGLTQAEAAALSGVGNRFLSELERGKASCELGKSLQVLTRLGVEVMLQPRGAKR